MAILYLFIGKQIITVNTFKVRKSVQNFQFILFSYYISKFYSLHCKYDNYAGCLKWIIDDF